MSERACVTHAARCGRGSVRGDQEPARGAGGPEGRRQQAEGGGGAARHPVRLTSYSDAHLST